ncbi:TlyA family RNA methyltransferase [Pontiella sulfatireligans]|uniref:16S/23S rRNA (Cytidine-2'-O)-methyltransferase TlyA n=1 Tax=Pontiella sulfatireligans TaxID=2750658 RepID=A0A6C2URU4_9BACT|nr:TlyA family RNA methyltransferase [Pontiella sulfatireligans]VGO22978.1 16S/23S rRNA (cytidine-2'-O)-methyltransferase TlyA [Pontiella sulfatireligans]
MPKIRLDQLLVQNNQADSREQAQRLIRAGMVRVNEQPANKPGHQYPDDATLFVKQKERYVSRGGLKIEGAHKQFGFKLEGAVCLDIGSSTGGFTDFMLQHGAVKVYAVDCGTNQLHYKLRKDPRVVVMENTNARYITTDDIPEPGDFCSIDTSFISLTKILPPLKSLMKPGGHIISLIKPQFEAGKNQVGKGGVVRDPAIHEEVIEKVKAFGTQELGFQWLGLATSPITGPAGNVEFLAYWEV